MLRLIAYHSSVLLGVFGALFIVIAGFLVQRVVVDGARSENVRMI